MRMQPKLVMGIAAAVLALTASAAAASPGRTAGGGAVLVSARHAPTDDRFTELRALDQVKRAVAWAEVERAWARQPHPDTRFTDQLHLAQVKRQAAWKAADRAAGHMWLRGESRLGSVPVIRSRGMLPGLS
jgi:hypothetical protein